MDNAFKSDRFKSPGFRKAAKGFTLIEIIIVIVIIGLIVAAAGNRIFGQGDKAKAGLAKAASRKFPHSLICISWKPDATLLRQKA